MFSTLRATIAVATIGLAGLSGAGNASAAPALQLPPPTIAADAQSGVALASGQFCYPRIVWTYRRGFGLRQIVIGTICIPYLVRTPVWPPVPGPNPERFGSRVAY